MAASSSQADVVIVDWNDLVNHDGSGSSLSRALETALGPDGIGLVGIQGVPGFVEAKMKLFPMAHTLATLPHEYLEKNLTDAASLYNAGWSHGKEKLGHNHQPDFGKGSFYYNPLKDLAGTDEDRKKYPLSYPANVWPSTNDDSMPAGFQDAAKNLGKILFEAVIELTKHLDSLLQQQRTSEEEADDYFLYNTMKDTDKVKARLLYYYPLKQQQEQTGNNNNKEDSWIGWHNDSGFFTALAGDLYVNHDTGTVLNVCPDPNAGLYVADRRSSSSSQGNNNNNNSNNNNNNNILRVKLPNDCMAIQIGECAQIITGGSLVATPHCVQGITDPKYSSTNVARISLACFVDTKPEFPLSLPSSTSSGGGCTTITTRDDVLRSGNHRVPPLNNRWTHDGMTFGDFLTRTFQMYYDWNNNNNNNNNKDNEAAAGGGGDRDGGDKEGKEPS